MLEDAARYQTMQETQQTEARKFREGQAKVYQEHLEAVAKKQKDHQDAINKEKEQIQHLTESIQIMQKKNRETMKQINKDADLEINEM